jgi:hypothetical protein
LDDIKTLVDALFSRDCNFAYSALNKLIVEVQTSNKAYEFFDLFIIAENARWDEDNKINKIIEKYLSHILDEKPTTSRTCIKNLSLIIQYKPELKPIIKKALLESDISKYKESMKGLLQNDIDMVLKQI